MGLVSGLSSRRGTRISIYRVFVGEGGDDSLSGGVDSVSIYLVGKRQFKERVYLSGDVTR